MRIRIVLLILLLVAGAACNRGDEEAVTSTFPTTVPSTVGSFGVVTQSDATPTTSTAPSTDGSAPLAVDPVPFEIAWQETSSDGVDSLVVLVANEEYTFDEMENLMRDVVDDYPAANSVRVVSDPTAVGPAVRYGSADADPADTTVLEQHFLVELVDGIRLIFRGPYEPMGQASLGS